MDRLIEVKVSGNYLRKDTNRAGVQGEANVTTLRITFDESWDAYAKKLTWWDACGENPVEIELLPNLLEDAADSTRIYRCLIPAEPLAVAGWCSFVIDGYIDGKRQRTVEDKLQVRYAPSTEGAGTPAEITPTVAEQLGLAIETLTGDIQLAAQVARSVERMTASAETGEPGSSVTVEKSTGEDGGLIFTFRIPRGDRGEQGIPGKDGKDGADGQDGTPFTYDMFTAEQLEALRGPQGIQGPIGLTGATGPQGSAGATGATGPAGKDGKDGNDGNDGSDGITPHIGENGNWWIGETDTGIAATGPSGADGVGIKSFSYNASTEDGGVNYLTILKTDGSSKVCQIQNGSKGSAGAEGPAGQRGTGVLAVTTAPSSNTTEIDIENSDGSFSTVKPSYRILISTVKSQSGASEVLVGDIIQYSYYQYKVSYVIGSYAYMSTRTSIRGAPGADGLDGEDGAPGADGVGIKTITYVMSTEDGGTNIITMQTSDDITHVFQFLNGHKGSTGNTGAAGPAGADGKDGADGYTPVKGTDYYTEADKAELVNAVIAALPRYTGGVS